MNNNNNNRPSYGLSHLLLKSGLCFEAVRPGTSLVPGEVVPRVEHGPQQVLDGIRCVPTNNHLRSVNSVRTSSFRRQMVQCGPRWSAGSTATQLYKLPRDPRLLCTPTNPPLMRALPDRGLWCTQDENGATLRPAGVWVCRAGSGPTYGWEGWSGVRSQEPGARSGEAA